MSRKHFSRRGDQISACRDCLFQSIFEQTLGQLHGAILARGLILLSAKSGGTATGIGWLFGGRGGSMGRAAVGLEIQWIP